MKVGIVTDTNSGMTQEEGKKYGIHILPMPFMIDGEIYHEGVNLSHEEFYRMQEEGADITTSQPSPEEVLGLWKELLETYDQLVHIPMSSSLSSSCQTAMMLAQEYEDRVFVVDNQRISITQRQSALDGKMMADRGMDGASIKKVLEDTRLDASIYVTVDTLKYLKKGGRITPAAAALGTLLRLKPVLTVQGGKLDAFAKARTMKQAKSIMITAIQNDLEQRFGDKGCKKDCPYQQSGDRQRMAEGTGRSISGNGNLHRAPVPEHSLPHRAGSPGGGDHKEDRRCERLMSRKRKALSMKIFLAAMLACIGILPMFLQALMVLGSYQQNQIDTRGLELQNRCLILSNKLSRSGYLDADVKDTLLDNEMDVLADIYSGRIVVVDKNYKIVHDSFRLSEGRIQISEEVLQSFRGESISRYNRDKHYFIHTAPIYEAAGSQNISGVLVSVSSTEAILDQTEAVRDKASLFQLLSLIILGAVICGMIYVFMKPINRFREKLFQVASGALDTDISENTYRETKEMSESVKETLKKLREADASRQEFVANVSHELKTPITSIRVLADSPWKTCRQSFTGNL